MGDDGSRSSNGDDGWLAPARDLIAFIDASPSPFHAVTEAARRLRSAGYTELDEREAWSVAAGDRRYVIKSGGTLIAFEAGTDPPASAGFLIVGAHTDSPNFRVKPLADVESVGYRQIGVEVYGGVLLTTWMDRDLSIAGRVTTADGASHLVRFAGAVCRMPNVAIHLNRNVNKNGLVLNAENHMRPVLEMVADDDPRSFGRMLSDALEAQDVRVRPEDVAGYDLCLFDVQGGAIGGTRREFLYSARLDNLASCHAAIDALVNAGAPGAPTRAVVLYDHEEVGSRSDAGAQSRFLLSTLERVARAHGGGEQAAERALAGSLLVSADMAHAVHPSYTDKHDKQHQPKIGKGPVLKVNAAQSYATDGPAAAIFEAACRAEDVPLQRFVSRSDMPCGSTIGPISAARTGIRTVDVGNPMLGMHSCRETAGTRDVEPMMRVMKRLLASGKPPAPNA